MIRAAAVLVVALFGAVPAGPDPAAHSWAFASREAIASRFPAPSSFTRVAVAERSFGDFLRTLPIAPEGARVTDFRGAPLYDDGHHPNISGVIDIDIGARDLQQCADAVIRLHAEWRYGRGDRTLRYHAASGAALAYGKWLAGERMVTRDGKTSLQNVAAARNDDHAAFRAWLDDVFAWANTSSLAREGSTTPFADVLPGDFFVMPGSPFGHAVLVLDVAKDEGGRTALLLGQSYMPAQSVQVLRPSPGAAWFVVEPGATEVKTPFWEAFPMRTLRRMP